MIKQSVLSLVILIGFSSCSPLRSSPNDEKHQLELTLHEVQTNLDDLRHDINCFQTELQIVDGRIKHFENSLASLKHDDLEKQYLKVDQLTVQIQNLERKWTKLEKNQSQEVSELETLSSHANETTAALSQFRDRIQELERDIYSQNRRFDDLAKLKTHIESLAKGLDGSFSLYRVKPGDSLEKIARLHKTGVDKIKQFNGLNQDMIFAGQELKIPTH